MVTEVEEHNFPSSGLVKKSASLSTVLTYSIWNGDLTVLDAFTHEKVPARDVLHLLVMFGVV